MAGLIDVGILKPELATSFATGYQQAEQTRQQNEMNQLKLDQLRQDRAMLTDLQTKLRAAGQSDDPNQFFKAMIQTGNPDYMAKGYEGLQRYKELQRAEQLLGAEFGTPAAAPAAAPANALAPSVAPAAPSANALATPPAAAPAAPAAPANALVAPDARVQELRRKIATYASVNDPRLKALVPVYQAELNELVKPQVVSPGATVFRGGQSVFTAPAAPTELQRNYDFARSQGFRGSLFDYERQLKEAGRAPAQPSAPVAVVDPDTGRQIYVSREEALTKKMTPASGMEGLTPKEIQKREAALPQAKASVVSFESKTDQFIKELEKLRDDPGLNQITGAVYGRTPSVSREGSRAQALYNKIFAKGGFQALQDLREASKTGGALGNVSNQEGERLERSIVGGLDRTQNIEDVKAGINALIEDLKVSKTRVRNTFDDTYSYKADRRGAGPAAPAPDPLGIR